MSDEKTPSSNISEHSSSDPANNYENQRARGLQNDKPTKQKENFGVKKESQPKLDREGYEKRMDMREENLKKQNANLNAPEKKIDKPNVKTKVPKTPAAIAIVKGAGKIAARIIPITATAITAYEAYEIGKDAYEYLRDSPNLEKGLEELHNKFPEHFPEPPKLEDNDKISLFSNEDKENIALAMASDQEREIESTTEIGQGKEMEELDMYAYQDHEEQSKIEMNFSEEDRENMMLAMADDVAQPDFPNEISTISMDYEIEDLSFYDGYDNSSSEDYDDDGDMDSSGDGGGGGGGDD